VVTFMSANKKTSRLEGLERNGRVA
jgi:hypothetical protein